jgi:hypothetical protein
VHSLCTWLAKYNSAARTALLWEIIKILEKGSDPHIAKLWVGADAGEALYIVIGASHTGLHDAAIDSVIQLCS